MWVARLVGRSLRWSIVEPLSEVLSFGLVSLMLSLILAIPVFHETADQDLGDDSDPTVFLPDCRAGPTSACATYNSVPMNEFPDVLIKATLATEDPRFYSHFGIDLAAIARSLHSSPQVDGIQSSVSQQVATILFPSNERTFEDGIHETLLAIWLEWRLTKDEILTIYLNRVQIGAGVFGVGDAARLYFKKQVQDVDLSEAAMLVGLLNGPLGLPSHIALLNARTRANVVLDKLVETGFMTEDQVLGARDYLVRQVLEPEEDSLN
ncbi:transglycosylase domain-containing protein [Bradyrhizobium sp. RDM4]|uniref:transglycosylase domain-containing protein n=1 Tax=Bradyrhizobium sp. RDM4 TaxID=3378765 RepID=UPI0038FD3B8C